MPRLDDYLADQNTFLADAALDPIFRHYAEESDFEVRLVDMGGGMMAQQQMLTQASVRRIVQRIIEAFERGEIRLADAAQQRIPIKKWICGDFEFCRRWHESHNVQGIIRAIRQFLDGKLGQGIRLLVDTAEIVLPLNFISLLSYGFCVAEGTVLTAETLVKLCGCDA